MQLQRLIKNYSASAATLLLLALAGCSSTKQPPGSAATVGGAQPAGSSFASSTVCAGNPFLQKYQCSFDRIQEAANSGDPDAQYALGYLYYYGIGTAQNKSLGLTWIERAAAQGQPIARDALKSLSTPAPVSHNSTAPSSASSTTSSNSSSTAAAVNNAPSAPVTNYLPNYGQKRLNTTEAPTVNLSEPAPQN